MRKLKIFALSILIMLCGGLFCACSNQPQDSELNVESIQVAGVGIDGLILRLGESVDIDIVVLPENATNKSFEAFGYDTNAFTIDVNNEEMKATITVTNSIEYNQTQNNVAFRTLADKSLQTILKIQIKDEEQTMLTPQNLQFDGEKFTWTAVEGVSGYTILLNNIPHIVSKNNVDDLTAYMYLNIDEYEGQTINARVKANGRSKNLDSDYSDEISFEIFKKPTNVKLSVQIDDETDEETNILTWDAVENVQSYTILINNFQCTSYVNSFDLTQYLNVANSYGIYVKSNTNIAKTKFESSYTEVIEVTRLSAPETINIANGSLRWNSVVGAKKYNVEYSFSKQDIFDVSTEVTKFTMFDLPFDIDPGIYNARIRAIGDNQKTLRSIFSQELTYTKLESIQNLKVENGQVKWNPVPYATNYIVYFENLIDDSGEVVTQSISQTSSAVQIVLDISNFRYQAGEYRLNIQPVGTDDKIAGNLLEDELIVKKLAVPKNVYSFKQDGISQIKWNKVEGAKSYQIFISNTSSNIYNVPATTNSVMTFEFSEGDIEAGYNLIYIRAIGEENSNPAYINSENTNPLTITKLDKPNLNLDNLKFGKISWQKMGDASGYQVTVINMEDEIVLDKILTTTSIDFNNEKEYIEYNLLSGTYKIQIKALAKDNQNIFDGEYSDVIVAKKMQHNIDGKSLVVTNGTIYDLEDADDYIFEYVITSKNNTALQQTLPKIHSYVEDSIPQNTEFYVQSRVIPVNSINEDEIYLISSNLSDKLYVKKLPTIIDISMSNGVLYYGSNYKVDDSSNPEITGFEFVLNVDGEDINNSTNRAYNFNGIEAGEHTVSVRAIGIGLNNNTYSDEKPTNLSSKVSEVYSFIKLAAPQDFKVSSFADGGEEIDVTIYSVIDSLNYFNFSKSGALCWSNISLAKSYKLDFNDGSYKMVDAIEGNTLNYETLQDTNIKAGIDYTVKIKAVGDGVKTITSDYSPVTLSFKKFYTPNSLEIISDTNGEKILKWNYLNGQDPNANISMTSLINNQSKIAVYVLVSDNVIYNTLEEDVDATNIVNVLKSNQCKLPKSLYGKKSIKVVAIPLNCYISSIFEGTIAITQNLSVISDSSPEVYVDSLITPRDLKMIDNIVQWSPLNYAENILDEYRLHFAYGEKDIVEDYIIIKEGEPSNSTGKIIYIENLNSQSNCQWIFNKENFEKAFGTDSYVPKVYSVSIQAIAKNNYYYEDTDSNKKIYYIDSKKSTSISVEVLANPEPRIDKGVIVWEEVDNAENYGIYITKPSGLVEYIETNDAKETILTLKDENLDLIKYPAGDYKIVIISLGDGKKTITSEKNEAIEKDCIKLEDVKNLIIKNGLIRYDDQLIVQDTSNNCLYTLFIRSAIQTEDLAYDNAKNNIFELADEFTGGYEYYIRVRATGDNDKYINSNFTDYCYVDDNNALPIKLATPKNVLIVDGKLVWDRVDNASAYQLNISGGEIEYRNIEQISTSYDFSGLPINNDVITYAVKLKAVGGSYCLNSSSINLNDIKKLGVISNMAINNGYVVWKYTNNSNYKIFIQNYDVTDEVIINFDVGTNAAEIIDIDNVKYVQYRLLNYNSGIYNISIINYGGNKAISSAQTEVISIEKLNEPANLAIEEEKLLFNKVEGATNYSITINVDLKNIGTKKYVYTPNDISIYGNEDIKSIPFIILEDFVKQQILTEIDYQYNIEKYTISVMAIGSTYNNLAPDDINTYYISSNDSDSLLITKPAKPVLWYNTEDAIDGTNDRFYGKISWSSVDADYYKVYVKAHNNSNHSVLYGYTLEDVVTENIVLKDGYNCYIVRNKTYANVIYSNESYSFIVVACKNKNGFDSDETSEVIALKNTQLYYDLSKTVVDFDIFEDELDGSVNNPYKIHNEVEFNVIKYNLEANYKIVDNIQFTTVPSVIGTDEAPFKGSVDGAIKDNNDNYIGCYNLTGRNGNLNINSNNNSFNGLFGVIDKSGVIKNLIFNANISAITLRDNKIEIAMISTKNYGYIYNVTTNGFIGSEYNIDSVTIYNAGITIYNFGTIESCLSNANVTPNNNSNDVYAGGIAVYNENIGDDVASIIKSGYTGSASGQFVGGICAYNLGGDITKCYYQSSKLNNAQTDNKEDYNNLLSQNKGKTPNYVGGIVGYMTGGIITECYVVGVINGTTNSAQSVYVGGLVGYIKSGEMSNSYVVGYKSGEDIITATGLQSNTVKLGVVCGQIGSNVYVYGIVCIKGTQKVSSAGNVSGVEVTVQQTTTSLKNSIEHAIINYNTIFDFSYDYPRLFGTKY